MEYIIIALVAFCGGFYCAWVWKNRVIAELKAAAAKVAEKIE